LRVFLRYVVQDLIAVLAPMHLKIMPRPSSSRCSIAPSSRTAGCRAAGWPAGETLLVNGGDRRLRNRCVLLSLALGA
jgi:hypothetical protein